MTGIPSPSPSPSWVPSPTPSYITTASFSSSTVTQKIASPPQASGRLPLSFSPTLIAMVAVVAVAFLLITYSRPLSRHLIVLLRRWRHRRRRLRYLLPSSSMTTFSHLDSSPSPPSFPFDYSPDAFNVYSPNGLNDAVIKTIPLSIYYSSHKTTPNKNDAVSIKECAVCLLEFEEREYVRTLPVCSHAFHVDCIDIWLRSHANCPLCRARIFPPDSPFVTVMSSRIRPSFHDVLNSVPSPVLQNTSINTITATSSTTLGVTEITPFVEEPSPRRMGLNVNEQLEVNNNDNSSSNGYRLLKRSYSFGFETSGFLDESERMLEREPATASPWRLRRRGFWSKRPLTPFKSRVFSLRYNYRGGGGIMKSPAFFRRKFPLSERFSNAGGGGASSSSRRSRYMVSPMFQRSSAGAGMFCSSRSRCGDPEALLSPERLNGRR